MSAQQTVKAARGFSAPRAAKRLFDITGALVFGAFALPVVLSVASLSWLSGQPAFFGHTRIGRNGRAFTCWKLRSMRPDSAACLKAHLAAHPDARQEWAETYQLRDDPRVTRLGAVLRKASLDELPQLWNVLVGEMSLVGPRPVTAEELDLYADASWAYFSVRPGMTGLWQIAHRRGAPYKRRLALDCAYAERGGVGADIRILAQTFQVVLRPLR